uniref:tRNA-binding domain-containing protein n=1 Tax=Odontella aurita TaxID=265563 RepID=A0A7S4N203_9STRA|mmetsp:Transcript_44183/g.134524  ORF Transcript_44183/g.134524 Transcript_44183/m.134524 type:complete len:504 (+) Transcript_44183:1-1512(+)
MTGVDSSAAVAKLTVSALALEKDGLLSLVVSLASPHQLKVNIKKKGNDLSLELSGSGDGSSATLTRRNAILRSLAGMGLHDALDVRYHLLGGNSPRASGGLSSPSSASSALALAGISSWMSTADSVRTGGGGFDLDGLLGHLDLYLASRSYLVPSPSATLADLDLALAIGAAAGDSLEEAVGAGRPNVRRWLVQCDAAATDLAGAGSANEGSKVEAKEVEGWIKLNPAPQPAPFFFFGEEGEEAIAAAAAASTAVAAPAAGKGGAATDSKGVKKGGGGGGGSGGGGGGDMTEEQKKAVAEKRAKAKAEKAAKKKGKQPQAGGGGGKKKGGNQPAAELDISALDIRVGRIIKAWEHEEAEKLYCEEVDVGEESGPRKIASGLRHFYKLEEMQDRRVLVLCNLKARNLVGFPSHGMVMCASNADHTAVEFAVPPEGAKIGERVIFEGHEGEPEPENKVAKKKMFEKLAPDLKTDGDGVVNWKGKKGMTSVGPCKAVNGMKDAQVA